MDNFYSTSSFGEDVCFMEADLTGSLLEHDMLNLINMYKIEVFSESGEQPSEKKNSILSAIFNRILQLMQKIGQAIQGFFDGLKSVGRGSHLTADEYMASDTAAIRLDEDIAQMVSDIDREYLSLRKCINKISNISHLSPELVEKVCDGVHKTVHEKRYVIADTTKGFIKAQAVERLSNKVASNLKSVQEDQKAVEQCVAILKARKEPVSPSDLNMLEKLSKSLYDINNAYISSYGKLQRASNQRSLQKKYTNSYKKKRTKAGKKAKK